MQSSTKSIGTVLLASMLAFLLHVPAFAQQPAPAGNPAYQLTDREQSILEVFGLQPAPKGNHAYRLTDQGPSTLRIFGLQPAPKGNHSYRLTDQGQSTLRIFGLQAAPKGNPAYQQRLDNLVAKLKAQIRSVIELSEAAQKAIPQVTGKPDKARSLLLSICQLRNAGILLGTVLSAYFAPIQATPTGQLDLDATVTANKLDRSLQAISTSQHAQLGISEDAFYEAVLTSIEEAAELADTPIQKARDYISSI